MLPLGCSLGGNPSKLQDFCASTAAWRSLGMMEAAVGTEHVSAARGGGTQPAPSSPVVPNTKPNQSPETVGTPEGRKEGKAFGSISILSRTRLFSPLRGTLLLQPLGLCREQEQNPTKAPLLQQKRGVPFVGALSSQRTRAPGLDGILGDEQPHPSHPERKTQREKNLLGVSLFSLLPLGSAEKMVRVQQERSLSCPFSGPPSHPSCRSCSWRGSHWSHLLFGAAASPSPMDGALEMQELLWWAQHSPEEPFAAVGDTKKAISVLCFTEVSAGRVYQGPEATRGPG